MKKKKVTNKIVGSSKGFSNILLVFSIICLLITIFSFQYYTQLHAAIKEESTNYLKEITVRIGSNIDRIINDNYAVLYTMTSTLENVENQSMADIRKVLKKQQAPWDYEMVMLIDSDGKAHDLDGKDIFLNIDDTFRDNILSGCQAMSTTQLINNVECILFSVPLNKTIEGKEMVALAAGYSPDGFEQVLSMTSFNEQAYSQVVTKNGTTVVRSSSPYAIKSGYNIFSFLEQVDIARGDSLEKMHQDIEHNENGRIGFEYDGGKKYVVYTTINPEDWYLLTFVPVEAVNGKSDMLLQITLILCGLITVTFAALLITMTQSFKSHRKRLEQIAYVDEVTGGNTIQKFYDLAREILDSELKTQYGMIFTNIEKFKVLNEQLGRQNCDEVLSRFNEYMQADLNVKECMGRLSADNFCILMQYTDERTLMKRLKKWQEEIQVKLEESPLPCAIPVTEFGIYIIDNRTLPFTIMVDRAKLALKESQHSVTGKIKVAFYDDQIRQQLIREKQLEDMMQKALDEKEFHVYLQPKYLVQEEKIGGAEALVRWISPDEGMIYPNDFIPLFEKNGFIIPLDLWVFEDVCRLLREWLDKGYEPVKISVNCSRVHLSERNFLVPYCRIVDKYKVPRHYLEIELTENIVLQNVEHLTKIIEYIHESGFGCSMDDFGSGYSSLNLIQSIPVDTLKLDKIFFQEGVQSLEKTEAVVGSIVNMAKALRMNTVAEGVEYREQVEMLKKVGCDYIQGYVFAKPMNTKQFEELAFEKQ